MTKEDLIKCGCWFTDTGELVKDDIDLNEYAKLVTEKERKRILDVIGDNQCECRCAEVVRGQA
jgi:hypothetical protein